jgi:hypothetical protein
MARFVTGTTFTSTQQVTAEALNNAVNNAAISTDSVDNSSIEVNSSNALRLKDSGVTTAKINNDAVDKTKIDFIADDLATTDTHILIADGTDFHNKAVSGDITITNAGVTSIKDNVALGGVPTAATASVTTDTTQIATTAFVQDVAAATVKIATYNLASGSASSDTTIQLTETTDPCNIASVSSGVITVAAGLYLIRFYGMFAESQGTFHIDYKVNGSIVAEHTRLDETSTAEAYQNFVFDHIIQSGSSSTIQIDVDEIQNFSSLQFRNVGVTVIKLPTI